MTLTIFIVDFLHSDGYPSLFAILVYFPIKLKKTISHRENGEESL